MNEIPKQPNFELRKTLVKQLGSDGRASFHGEVLHTLHWDNPFFPRYLYGISETTGKSTAIMLVDEDLPTVSSPPSAILEDEAATKKKSIRDMSDHELFKAIESDILDRPSTRGKNPVIKRAGETHMEFDERMARLRSLRYEIQQLSENDKSNREMSDRELHMHLEASIREEPNPVLRRKHESQDEFDERRSRIRRLEKEIQELD